jgi:two-component system sensor histidine kinase AlgZ
MAETLETDFQSIPEGVYPPSFCTWRMLAAVSVITEVCVILLGLAGSGFPDWSWLGLATLYGQWLALFCASGVCVISGWTSRLSARGAWIGSWVTAVLLSMAFSYAAWLMAGFSGLQSGDGAGVFVLKSTLSVGLISVVFFRYLLIRTKWRAELIAQSEARVQALQARIRPHFLFNSLNTIASLIPVDPDNAEAATLDLADIFRGSMRRADRPISLGDELQLARQYLDMEKRRLGRRLQVDWRVDELPPQASVLPLMLQPLLENAVGHGVQSNPEGGKIVVYGRAEGDQIVVTIRNPAAAEEHISSGHGMALENIRERLALAFGPRASLHTSQDAGNFYTILSVPYVEYSDR